MARGCKNAIQFLMKPTPFLDIALQLANIAREPALQFFRSTALSIDNKQQQGFDPVTLADRAVERAIREYLAENRPYDSILGEEYGETRGENSIKWIIDPIDGTKGFIAGQPTWGTLIAAVKNEKIIAGVISQPYIGEVFCGSSESSHKKAYLIKNNAHSPLKTRSPRPLSEAILMSTFPEIGSNKERQAFDAVAKQAKLTRFGTDCYAYALLALGQIDLVIEAGLQSYDIAAPIAVIEAAGGIVTNWQGGTALKGGQIIAAANSDVYEEARAILLKNRL